MAYSANKRIIKNTAFLYLRMLFVLIISLYTSRVVINTLGVDDFGVYNVVAGFVTMFGFLNATLSSSMQRFYNYEGAINKEDGYQKVYSTGFLIHLGLALLLIVILESIGLWYVNKMMVIPQSSLLAANVVYQTSIFSMAMVIIQIPYTGALMADERMDFYAFVSIIDVVLKLIIVIILPYLPFDKLIVYGLLLLTITIFDTIAYIIYAKRVILIQKLSIQLDKELFKSLLSFSGWNLLGTFAFLLKGQGLNMLLNYYFGVAINAARGIAYQVNGATNVFSANIATAFRPQIVNSYASEDYKRTRKLFFIESKVCFILLGILMIPVILELNYLLKLWLGGTIPKYTNIFTALVLLDTLVCTLNTPCTQVAYAVGNLKKYQIITSCINLCLLPFCWIALNLGYDSTSVFIATIIFSILNQTACLILLNQLFKYGIFSYFKDVLLPCMAGIILIPILPCIVHSVVSDNLLRLIFVTLADISIGMIIIYMVVLSSAERITLKKLLKSYLTKHQK